GRKPTQRLARGYRFHPSQVLLLVLALLCAIPVLFVRRPNQDDVVYFHRALSQVSALNQPIFLRQISVDMDATMFSWFVWRSAMRCSWRFWNITLESNLSTFIR